MNPELIPDGLHANQDVLRAIMHRFRAKFGYLNLPQEPAEDPVNVSREVVLENNDMPIMEQPFRGKTRSKYHYIRYLYH